MAQTRDRIVAYIQEFGPQTMRELSEGLEMSFHAVDASTYAARRAGVLYVYAWRRNSMTGSGASTHGKPSPVLAVGPGKDAPPLKPIPSIVRKRAYRQRMAPIVNARLSPRSRGPFEVMVQHLKEQTP